MQRGRAALGRTLGGGLAWIERGSRSEGGETGKTCLRPWALSEPRDQAVDIDGGSDRDVLHVGLRHAPVPGPAQAAGVVALDDDGHVEEQRQRYRERLELMASALSKWADLDIDLWRKEK